MQGSICHCGQSACPERVSARQSSAVVGMLAVPLCHMVSHSMDGSLSVAVWAWGRGSSVLMVCKPAQHQRPVQGRQLRVQDLDKCPRLGPHGNAGGHVVAAGLGGLPMGHREPPRFPQGTGEREPEFKKSHEWECRSVIVTILPRPNPGWHVLGTSAAYKLVS